MKKLHSIIFYALVTPAITLSAGSALAQQANTQYEENTPRTQQNETQRDRDRKDNRAQQRNQHQDYIGAIPANGNQASKLMGASVSTSNNENLGSVEDLIIDSNGQIVAVVVSVGGFLGMGQKDVAINWHNVNKSGQPDDLKLQVNASRDELRSAPEFDNKANRTTRTNRY